MIERRTVKFSYRKVFVPYGMCHRLMHAWFPENKSVYVCKIVCMCVFENVCVSILVYRYVHVSMYVPGLIRALKTQWLYGIR